MIWDLPIRNPKPGTQFRRHRGRLALFQRANGGEDYWRGYWREPGRRDALARARAGGLGEYEDVLTRYLPRAGYILEAGCGMGLVVAALAVRGYVVMGVDSEPEVIEFAKREVPELDLRKGNVLSLELSSGAVAGYLSFGVVEHFENGPGPALFEARRVLGSSGVAIISVPYLNPYRESRLRQLRESEADHLQFHQYYFSEAEMVAQLDAAGFEVIDTFPYAVDAFLTREHPVVATLWKSGALPGRAKAVIRRVWLRMSKDARRRNAHMLGFVCRVRRDGKRPAVPEVAPPQNEVAQR